MIELWRAGGRDTLDLTPESIEAAGWDGQTFMDSQSLGADPYALMGYWAARTERLRLSTGVTNPLTRHPAVTAASIASVQAVSRGRAVLGIGRGDSALAYLGLSPAPLATFERALADIRDLLAGETTAFRLDLIEGASSSDDLELGDRPAGTQLGWLDPAGPRVPLDVAASGPRVIALAARYADRITVSVGAQADRIRWAVDQAQTAAAAHGRDHVGVGAQVVVVCHRNPEQVAETAWRLALPLARFQVMQGTTAAGPRDAADEAAYAQILRAYDMNKHAEFTGTKLVDAAPPADFLRKFVILGTPDECTERLSTLVDAGIDRFVVFGPGFHDDEPHGGLFAREVIPSLRNVHPTPAPAPAPAPAGNTP